MSAVQQATLRTLLTSVRHIARGNAHAAQHAPADWTRLVRSRAGNLVLYSGFMSTVLFWPAAVRVALNGRV
ncbi:hypothetical protein MN608_07740 [Microdochium nivale]|nr:hypothetical protein MN608_07740 [Microdochium nivale]